jgi:hypothetical protein
MVDLRARLPSTSLAPREIARRYFGNREPNPRNPRRNFSDTELDELASSIRGRGIVQPIVVRPARSYADTFEIIAGERRWRAGLHQVPIVAPSSRQGLRPRGRPAVCRSRLNLGFADRAAIFVRLAA